MLFNESWYFLTGNFGVFCILMLFSDLLRGSLRSYIVLALAGTEQTHRLRHDGNRSENTQSTHQPDILDVTIFLCRVKKKTLDFFVEQAWRPCYKKELPVIFNLVFCCPLSFLPDLEVHANLVGRPLWTLHASLGEAVCKWSQNTGWHLFRWALSTKEEISKSFISSFIFHSQNSKNTTIAELLSTLSVLLWAQKAL